MKNIILTIALVLFMVVVPFCLYAHGDEEHEDTPQSQTVPAHTSALAEIRPMAGTNIMGIEIIPNLHPIFVHFTVALLIISTALFVLERLSPTTASWKSACITVARGNLWIGIIITIATLFAGFHAYNTVNHDDISHLPMLDHRNWALTTAGVFIVLTLWSFLARKKEPTLLFACGMIIASSLLIVTAYKGGELVYRHGLGVMALPQPDNHMKGGHKHTD